MILDELEGTLLSLRRLLFPERVSVIIPCYNEERTLDAIIRETKRSWLTKEVIVVDDGSTDRSAQIAEENYAVLVRHNKNKGKGAAIMSGARAARNPLLVFIDADLENFSHETIEKLAGPVTRNEAGICKASFAREAGRVTELVAKPLLEFVYPEAGLAQPLSGQFCIRKELLLSLDFPRGWGVDVSIVLSALKRGEKIAEADIGQISHKHRDLPSLAKTAREVTKTILQSAGFRAKKHKLVVFDFDGTLVGGSSIRQMARALGLQGRLERQTGRFRAGRISERQLTEQIARILKGVHAEDFRKAASEIRPARHAVETLEYLRRMGYRIAVVSFAFKEAITATFPEVRFDAVVSPSLEVRNGVFTGKVRLPPFRSATHVFSKGKAIRSLMRRFGAKRSEAIAVGNDKSDVEMFAEAGISVSINPMRGVAADKRIRALPELLIIAS